MIVLIFLVLEVKELKNVYGNGFPVNLKIFQYKGIQDVANTRTPVYLQSRLHMDLIALYFPPSK